MCWWESHPQAYIQTVFLSYARCFGINEEKVNLHVAEFSKTLGEELLTPTKIYVKPLMKLLDSVDVHGISHITGGGFYENIPRMLNEKSAGQRNKGKCAGASVFELISKTEAFPNTICSTRLTWALE